MSLRAQRRLLLSSGALLGLLLVGVVALALPAQKHKQHVHCLPYLLIPSIHVCGPRVYLFAAGRRQYMGATKDFYPMPKPRPKETR